MTIRWRSDGTKFLDQMEQNSWEKSGYVQLARLSSSLQNDAPFSIACKFLEMQTGIFGRMESACWNASSIWNARAKVTTVCFIVLNGSDWTHSFDQRTILVMLLSCVVFSKTWNCAFLRQAFVGNRRQISWIDKAWFIVFCEWQKLSLKTTFQIQHWRFQTLVFTCLFSWKLKNLYQLDVRVQMYTNLTPEHPIIASLNNRIQNERRIA